MGLKSSTHAAASYVRTTLAQAIRKNPYQVNVLMAGYDVPRPLDESAAAAASAVAGASPNQGSEDSSSSGTGSTGPSLYWLDYLGSGHKVNYGAHGYCGYFLLATMDRHWREGMSVEEGVELVRTCLKALKTRFILNQQRFRIKIATKEGIREIPFDM
jgi:20S proteasome subunit beta 4